MLVLASVLTVALSLIEVRPLRISRLTLPVYSSEHCLHLVRSDDDSDDGRVLPVLLRFAEGERLERFFGGITESIPLSVECIARKKLFEAAASRSFAPWDMIGVADGCSSLSAAVLRFAAQQGWSPQGATLYLESELFTGGTGVARYREEYASSASELQGEKRGCWSGPLRNGEVASLLRCTGDDRAKELSLELDGPGEAVLFAREGRIALSVSEETWDKRAVEVEQLPEAQPGAGTSIL